MNRLLRRELFYESAAQKATVPESTAQKATVHESAAQKATAL